MAKVSPIVNPCRHGATSVARNATFALETVFQANVSRAVPFSLGRCSFAIRMTNGVYKTEFCNVTGLFNQRQLSVETITETHS